MKVRITQLTMHGMCPEDQFKWGDVPKIGEIYETEGEGVSPGTVIINDWRIGREDYEVVEE